LWSGVNGLLVGTKTGVSPYAQGSGKLHTTS
jgi:hypothetical protein